MARLLRTILRFARWVSLLLLLGGVVLWIASYWRAATFYYQSAHYDPLGSRRTVHVIAVGGRFFVAYSADFRPQEPPGRWVPRASLLKFTPIRPPWERPAISDLWRFFWIARYQEYPNRQGHVRNLTINVPLWVILALFAVLPAGSAIARLRRTRRLRRGQCIKCGYDVRASTDRCPECGTALHAGVDKLLGVPDATQDLATMKEQTRASR